MGDRAQSPFDQTTGRCHEEAEQRWQVLRAMHDLGPPRREKPPLTARFPRHVSKTARLHPEMDTWGEDLAIFTPKSMHEAKMMPGRGGLLRAFGRKGTHTARFLPAGPRAAAVQGRDARFYGAARWVAALAERARRAAGLAGAAGTAVVGAAVRRCGGRDAGDSTGTRGTTGAMEAGDGCREESRLARRNTPARVAAIRPNWRALPRRALRALR